MSTISTILEEANANVKTIMAHAGNRYLRNIMEAAFIESKKFILPEGEPPYTKNTNHPDQLSGTFWQVAKKIDIFQRADLKPLRREGLFVQTLESLSPIDAKIFILVKEQNLQKMFPKLTKSALEEVGYFKP